MAIDFESRPAHRHSQRSFAAAVTGVAAHEIELPRDGGFRAACEVQDRRFVDAMLKAHPELFDVYASRSAVRAALVVGGGGGATLGAAA